MAATPGHAGGDQAIAGLVRDWVAVAAGRRVGGADDLYQQLLNLVEPPLLTAVLEKHHGGRAAAARTLGLHRMTLRKKLTGTGLNDRSEED